MRLSTAIILGSTTCKLKPGNMNHCAFGCAMNATGIPKQKWFNASRYHKMHELWPWTFDGGFWNPFASQIMRLFDRDVCDGTMSLDELADYVRSIEPDCDCCRFGCTCAQIVEQVTEVTHAQEA